MPSDSYNKVTNNLNFLGDILCDGIVKKGAVLACVDPETATADEMIKAIDLHIGPSLIDFMGPNQANTLVMRMKKELKEQEE